MRSNEIRLIRDWYRFIDQRAWRKAATLLDSRYKVFSSGMEEAMDAHQHLKYLHVFSSALKGRHEVALVLEQDGWVAVSGTWKGRHTGTYFGVEATDEVIQCSWSDFFFIQNGKIKEERREMHIESILLQIQKKTQRIGA